MLDYNHQVGILCWRGKVKNNKMVVPESPICSDTRKTMSKGIDEIELIVTK